MDWPTRIEPLLSKIKWEQSLIILITSETCWVGLQWWLDVKLSKREELAVIGPKRATYGDYSNRSWVLLLSPCNGFARWAPCTTAIYHRVISSGAILPLFLHQPVCTVRYESVAASLFTKTVSSWVASQSNNEPQHLPGSYPVTYNIVLNLSLHRLPNSVRCYTEDGLSLCPYRREPRLI